MSEKIPVIDFATFREGDLSQRSAVAAKIYRACQSIGFIYLKNPGIDSNLITETFGQSQKFFNRTLSEKNQLAWSDKFSNRGYVGVGRERLDESKPGDLTVVSGKSPARFFDLMLGVSHKSMQTNFPYCIN